MSKQFSPIVLGALLFALYCPAQAQQAGKVYRVGRLSGGLASSTYSIDALRRELRELGYVEGKNIIFEFRYAEEKPERQQALADELAHLKLDLIIAGGLEVAQPDYPARGVGEGESSNSVRGKESGVRRGKLGMSRDAKAVRD